MTSDAKIGLLLGLVFIFIIAFVINGLPRFRNDRNNNELTTRTVGSQNDKPGIGRIEREVIKQTFHVGKQTPAEVEPPTTPTSEPFTIPLSETPQPVAKTVEDKPAVPPELTPVVENKQSTKPEPSRPTLPRVYVVAADDSLSTIAKKFYGPEEGNKIKNITGIFQANRSSLKSPDEIYEGQKLIIPALSASDPGKSKPGGIFAGSIFEKVESIGKRHFSAPGSEKKPARQYVVQEGDSLWQIAAERLGDATRYTEIARLNAASLDDKNRLIVGMRLKMPAR
jgi:nucleoid-associated protein YgaU